MRWLGNEKMFKLMDKRIFTFKISNENFDAIPKQVLEQMPNEFQCSKHVFKKGHLHLSVYCALFCDYAVNDCPKLLEVIEMASRPFINKDQFIDIYFGRDCIILK